MLNKQYALISTLALGALFAGCGPTDPNGFDGNDALGDYAVVVDTNVTLTTNYSVVVNPNLVGDAAKQTSAQVPYSLINGTTTDPVFTTFQLSYDAANHKFVLTVNSGSGSPSLIDIAEETAVATGEDGSVHSFSPTLTHLKSVTIGVALNGISTSDLSNGCQVLASQDLSLTITTDGLSGVIHAMNAYATHAVYEGTTPVPYVSCFDALAAIENRIRTNMTETSSFPLFVANGATLIDHLTDVVSIEEEINLVGPKKATAASKGTLSIQNGTITGFAVHRAMN